MTPKLRALLLLVGTLGVGGVTYFVAVPRVTTSRAELLDAGVNQFCDPAHLECQVRVHCRGLPDGGLRPRYGTVEVKGYLCNRDSGTDVLILRWPRDGGNDCYEPVGPSEDACTFVEPPGTCADNSVCDDSNGGTPIRAAQDRCACRQPDAGLCRTPNPDGGVALQIPLGATVAAPFAGAGCVRKVCAEVNGEQGQSWPQECPQ